MYYIDTHTHTCYSFDGKQTVTELCESAIAHGISMVAITDHLDADGEFEGYYTHYDAAAAHDAVMAARESYRGKLTLSYGIELGQPYTHPRECAELLDRYRYDFVIGSLHNLVRVPDFSFYDFSKMSDELIKQLWSRALDETENLLLNGNVHTCKINTLGHLTYPVRYIKRAGRDLDMTPFLSKIEAIYKKLTESGIALEVNTSGIRQGAGMTFPDESLLRLYRECGGELLTIGSDAHFSKDVGADIPATYKTLADIGFKNVFFFGENGMEAIEIK